MPYLDLICICLFVYLLLFFSLLLFTTSTKCVLGNIRRVSDGKLNEIADTKFYSVGNKGPRPCCALLDNGPQYTST